MNILILYPQRGSSSASSLTTGLWLNPRPSSPASSPSASEFIRVRETGIFANPSMSTLPQQCPETRQYLGHGFAVYKGSKTAEKAFQESLFRVVQFCQNQIPPAPSI
ncbi:hypothetical protein BC938DRAFT_480329 [Jimgerdemannia flammicorona]|uniref:Uncharacterized protein n=1 Tax=Jimgerdemannia flammicorona TaxID=994334 RepID=A0A433QIU3_9FUNG|nr:hypothetical protein BC938DRAFT_480329 [Jimgerdemannia flammicorona]